MVSFSLLGVQYLAAGKNVWFLRSTVKNPFYRRSFTMSRKRFPAGFKGTRTEVQAPCREGVSQWKRLVSQETARYSAGEL